MRSLWRRLQRVELGLELALMGAIVELFARGIRPGIDIGCGSMLSGLTDHSLEVVMNYRLAIVAPIIATLIELRVAFRPWVKRAVRLGAGALALFALFSYSLAIWSLRGF